MGDDTMKKKLLVFVGIIGLILLVACGSGDNNNNNNATNDEAENNDVVTTEEVEELVKGNCTNCHGGEIDSVPGDHLSVADLKEVILEGTGDMPAIDVTDEEAQMIAEYLTE